MHQGHSYYNAVPETQVILSNGYNKKIPLGMLGQTFVKSV